MFPTYLDSKVFTALGRVLASHRDTYSSQYTLRNFHSALPHNQKALAEPHTFRVKVHYLMQNKNFNEKSSKIQTVIKIFFIII